MTTSSIGAHAPPGSAADRTLAEPADPHRDAGHAGTGKERAGASPGRFAGAFRPPLSHCNDGRLRLAPHKLTRPLDREHVVHQQLQPPLALILVDIQPVDELQ